MTLQQLIAAGLTESQAQAVLSIHKSTLDGTYVTKDRFNQVNDDLKAQKAVVAERDTQLETLKKETKDVEGLQKQIADLQESNKTAVEKLTSEAALNSKKAALKLHLLADEAGKPHNIDMVVGMFDMSKVELDDNGGIKNGYKEQNESIRKTNSFLFVDGKAPTSGQATNPWWAPVGVQPAEGTAATATPQQQAASYGAKLAQAKNAMMGVQPTAQPNTTLVK